MEHPEDATRLERILPTEEELASRADDGVDLTLIRWMLSLTPLERLEVLQNSIDSILRLRESGTER